MTTDSSPTLNAGYQHYVRKVTAYLIKTMFLSAIADLSGMAFVYIPNTGRRCLRHICEHKQLSIIIQISTNRRRKKHHLRAILSRDGQT